MGKDTTAPSVREGLTDDNCPRLTKRQAAIIGAYTGITCGPFSDVHEYVDSLPGFKGITTIGFSHQLGAAKIAEAAKADFLALCHVREP